MRGSKANRYEGDSGARSLRGRYLPFTVALLWCVVSIAQAEEAGPVAELNIWSPLQCMKAVDALLHSDYRSEMQARCITIPGLMCHDSAEPSACFATMAAELDAFVDDTRAKLPSKISSEKEYMPRLYLRALQWSETSPSPQIWCMEKPEATEELCRFLDHLQPAMAIFTAARWADVDLRRDDRQIYIEPETSDSVADRPAQQYSRINPINCFSAAFAIEWRFPGIMGLECVEISVDHCVQQDDFLLCIEDQISRMTNFVLFVHASLPEVSELPLSEQSYYEFRLDYFSDLVSKADLCDQPTLEAKTICRFTNYAHLSMSAFELADQIDPNFLISLGPR